MKLIIILALGAILCGCSHNQTSQVQTLQTRVDLLEAEVKLLSGDIAQQSELIRLYKQKVDLQTQSTSNLAVAVKMLNTSMFPGK
jgi:outer membrane murein-binding lipoprotein Lpp